MSSESFTISKKALITLVAASIVVIISLGIRQTFGLFYFDFNTDLDISISHFGFVMGLQLLLWGVFSPLFGVLTDKYGGAVAIFIGFVFYLVGILLFYSGRRFSNFDAIYDFRVSIFAGGLRPPRDARCRT